MHICCLAPGLNPRRGSPMQKSPGSQQSWRSLAARWSYNTLPLPLCVCRFAFDVDGVWCSCRISEAAVLGSPEVVFTFSMCYFPPLQQEWSIESIKKLINLSVSCGAARYLCVRRLRLPTMLCVLAWSLLLVHLSWTQISHSWLPCESEVEFQLLTVILVLEHKIPHLTPKHQLWLQNISVNYVDNF